MGQLRDRRASSNYFDNLIATYRKAMEVGRSDIEDLVTRQNNPQRYVDHAHFYQRAAFVVTNAMYSSGASIADVADCARELLHAEVVHNRALSELGTGPAGFDKLRAEYVNALQILSLGVLVDTPDGKLGELAAASGSQGMDAVYDFLATASHGSGAIGDSVVWPKPYATLLEVIRGEAGDRPALMRAFLKGWYTGNRGVDWWGTHREIKDGRWSYSGYWCYEAAAVTKVLQIDDTCYRDNEYYPRDLLAVREG